jgi:CubicO group peptidase (beta-lactamase class C family)
MAVRGPGMPRLTVAALIALAALPAGGDAEAVVQPNARQIAAVVDPLIRADLAESGIPGAAFVFVRDGGTVYQQGYGVSDLSSRAPVDPETTVWPIASITKVVTVIAALQLVDQQRVELDADLNRYLKRIQVPAQGYAPLSLRHVLTHTGALDEIPGRQFDGRTAPDLAAFLEGKLLRYRAPGLLTAYSTYGIALAGVLVEDVSGQTYADYVQKRVLRPAGMSHARVMTTLGDEKGVATPNAVDDGKAQAVPYEWYVTAPASSVVASAADMGRLAIAMLADARADAGRLLTAQQARAMQTQQATNHPRIPGWSLGMQMDRVNGVELAEHGGDIAGFSALFALMPGERSGFFIVHHGEGGDLRFRVKQALLDALYPQTSAPAAPAPDPNQASTLAEYGGRYISSIACRSCAGSGDDAFQVEVGADGTLTLWGQTWIPLDRDLFIRDDGKRMLGFTRNTEGKVISVTGGSWRVADRLQ